MIELRPYQQEAIDALHAHICTKETNPCIVIPTGGGKSILIAWAIKQWKAEYPKFRCVVLAHRKELVQQNYDEFRATWDAKNGFLSSEIGIYSAGLRKRDYEASVLFASIDSMYRRSGDFSPFDVVMVDEAHRIPMRGEGKYLTFLRGCQRFNKQLRVIGWTATPFRMGSGPICHKDHLLHEICYEARVTDLIDQGFLCGLRSKVGSVAPDLQGVRKQYGEYSTSSLAKATNKDKLVREAVGEAVRIIVAEGRKSAMFFCVDVEHCHAVSAALHGQGVVAPAITGKTRPEIRDKVGRDFKNGKLRAVCNVNVYTEGFNATNIDCIVLLRPTLSAGLFSQMVGRGLRKHCNKHDCLVLDFAHCIDEHGPVDTLGTSSLVAMAVCATCRESFSRATRKCPQCGWEIPKQEMERLEAVEEAKRRMHDKKPSDRAILSNVPETFKVDEVYVSRHCKPGKPDSLLVRYRCGIKVFREWICLDHPEFAGRHAQTWWALRFGRPKHNGHVSVNDALSNLFTSQAIESWTKTVTVRKSGKYSEIVGYNRPLTG